MHRNHRDISEAELLNLYFRTGDPEYLGIALQKYTVILLGVGNKYVKDTDVAQDLVQQVFLKALEKLPAHITNLGGWLYQVMRNECMDYLRKTPGKHLGEAWIQEEAEERDEGLHWAKVMEEEKLKEVLQELKEEQRICIELFYFKDRSYQEIAEITGWSMNEVKSYIQNGKRNLKIKMESDQRN